MVLVQGALLHLPLKLGIQEQNILIYRFICHLTDIAYFFWSKFMFSYGKGKFWISYTVKVGVRVHTKCPRSSYPFYIVTYNIKGVTTSWSYSIKFSFTNLPIGFRRSILCEILKPSCKVTLHYDHMTFKILKWIKLIQYLNI